MASEVIEADLGAVNCHEVVLEKATPEDRELRQEPLPEEPVVEIRPRKRQSQIAEKEHRGEELGRRRAEEHSQQQARIKRTGRAVPDAGETYKVNNVSHKRSWTDYERQGYEKPWAHGSTTRIEDCLKSRRSPNRD